MPLAFRPAAADDFERLLALRIAAMRPSLERLGRFDPARARVRFAETFAPERTRLIFEAGRFAGCVAVRPVAADEAWIEHFYLDPACQGRRIGARTLAVLTDEADRDGVILRLEVLRESDANRFYQRHGFAETHRAEWDIYYARPPIATALPMS